MFKNCECWYIKFNKSSIKNSTEWQNLLLAGIFGHDNNSNKGVTYWELIKWQTPCPAIYIYCII